MIMCAVVKHCTENSPIGNLRALKVSLSCTYPSTVVEIYHLQLFVKYMYFGFTPNLDRRTPLGIAVSRGHTETVRALLEAGASIHSSSYDNYGRVVGSLVHEAVNRGYGHICTLLLQAMAITSHVKRIEDNLD